MILCMCRIELPLPYCTECEDVVGDHRQLSCRFFLVLRDDAGMEMVVAMSGEYAVSAFHEPNNAFLSHIFFHGSV